MNGDAFRRGVDSSRRRRDKFHRKILFFDALTREAHQAKGELDHPHKREWAAEIYIWKDRQFRQHSDEQLFQSPVIKTSVAGAQQVDPLKTGAIYFQHPAKLSPERRG